MTYTHPGFYVLDDTCPLGIEDAIVAGPFGTAARARMERETLNIADDCSVYQLDRDAQIIKRCNHTPGLSA